MSRTKTVDYTGVRSKPLPRPPMLRRKSSPGMTMTTLKSSYASTPSKFYVSEQGSLPNHGESPTLLARSAQGIHAFNNKSTSLGRRSDTQQHERPGRSLRINTGPGNGGGGVGATAHPQSGGGERKEANTVEIYTPESDIRTPHLISKNTITYHSNFFERPHLEEGEEEARGGSNDPLEIEELEVELRSPNAVDPPAFAFGGNAEVGPATSTPVVGRGALSPVDLDSVTSSDFYQNHQYQQQLQQLRNQPHTQSPSPPSVPPAPLPLLPSHRNRSQRSYDAHPTSPGGRTRGGSSSRGRRRPAGLEYFGIEGSWAFDAAGKAYFRGTGKIEEVREGEDNDQEKMQVDQMAPKMKSSPGSTGLDSQNRLTAFHTPPQEPFEVTSPLPPTTTPPPRPKRIEEVVLSPGGTNFSIPKTVLNSTPGLSEIGIARANGNFSGHGFGHIHRHRAGLDVQLDLPMDLDVPFAESMNTPPPVPLPAALPAPPPEPVIQHEPEELDLETQSLLQMLKHVDNGVKDVVALRDYFIRTCAVYSILRKHIDVTYRVESALLEVHAAIDRRRNIPQSHLDIRTAEWQEKFELRTIQRLTALREFVEKRRKLTEQHLEELFQRLLAHEMKYIDIASKLHASYDRLKLHHLHTRLESAYKAEAETHKERKARKRKSYLRKRAEARLERNAGASAGLRERGPAAT